MDRPKPTGHGLPYRMELDGMRAVAVLAVVLFHARLGCPGGFVGVDIFFVLSGFLITSLILRDLDQSKFSLIDFWERRIRRIVPALTVWVAATLIAGWWLYLPADFERLGQAVVAQGLVLSNVFHGWKINYFTPSTEAFPLLHTWSLAVEEQFYIVLPVVLMAVHKWMPRWLRPMLIVTCLVSFCFAVWLTQTWARVSFWILPTRAWELLFGAVLAAYPQTGTKAPWWLKELMNWIGLTAIFGSIVFFDEHLPFPGVATLVPTLGTVAFIWSNAGTLTAGGHALSWRPMVFIGKVSYSFYLIHWPVIAYADYWYRQDMTWPVRMSLMMVAFVLSVASLLIFETPIRKGALLSTRGPLFTSALATTLLLMLGGLFIDRGGGFHDRFGLAARHFFPPDPDTTYEAAQLSVAAVEKGRLFEFGDRSSPHVCVAWGDSHAMSLMPVFDDLCQEKGLRGYAVMCSNTPPLLDFVYEPGLGVDTPRFNAAALQRIREHRAKFVLMTASWTKYATDPTFGPSLKRTVDELTGSGVQVILIRDVPIHKGYVPRALARAVSTGQDVARVGVSVEAHRQKNQLADEWLLRMAGPGVTVLDPTEYLTDETGLCRAEFDGYAMYRDSAHLAAEGALRLRPMFDPIFRDSSEDATATLTRENVNTQSR